MMLMSAFNEANLLLSEALFVAAMAVVDCSAMTSPIVDNFLLRLSWLKCSSMVKNEMLVNTRVKVLIEIANIVSSAIMLLVCGSFIRITNL